MTKIQFDINGFVGKIQSKNGQRVTYSRLAEVAGKKRYAIQSMASNASYQDLLDMLATFIDFAKAEGFDAKLSDLFTVTDTANVINSKDTPI